MGNSGSVFVKLVNNKHNYRIVVFIDTHKKLQEGFIILTSG